MAEGALAMQAVEEHDVAAEVTDFPIWTPRETELYSQRSKLYCLREKEWKERGLGEAKLLQHPESGRVRFILQEEKTMKISANHYVVDIVSYCSLKPNAGSTKCWVWSALDNSDGELNLEVFALKFSSPELAVRFEEEFNRAKELNLRAGAFPDVLAMLQQQLPADATAKTFGTDPCADTGGSILSVNANLGTAKVFGSKETGEEEEEEERELYSHRSALYCFRQNEWQERGLGDAKLLQHCKSGRARFIFRQESTMKIVANHYIVDVVPYYCYLQPNAGCTNRRVWIAQDKADGNSKIEQFALEFRSPEFALMFEEEFNRARELTSTAGAFPDFAAQGTDAASIDADKDSEAQSPELKLFANPGSPTTVGSSAPDVSRRSFGAGTGFSICSDSANPGTAKISGTKPSARTGGSLVRLHIGSGTLFGAQTGIGDSLGNSSGIGNTLGTALSSGLEQAASLEQALAFGSSNTTGSSQLGASSGTSSSLFSGNSGTAGAIFGGSSVAAAATTAAAAVETSCSLFGGGSADGSLFRQSLGNTGDSFFGESSSGEAPAPMDHSGHGSRSGQGDTGALERLRDEIRVCQEHMSRSEERARAAELRMQRLEEELGDTKQRLNDMKRQQRRRRAHGRVGGRVGALPRARVRWWADAYAAARADAHAATQEDESTSQITRELEQQVQSLCQQHSEPLIKKLESDLDQERHLRRSLEERVSENLGMLQDVLNAHQKALQVAESAQQDVRQPRQETKSDEDRPALADLALAVSTVESSTRERLDALESWVESCHGYQYTT